MILHNDGFLLSISGIEHWQNSKRQSFVGDNIVSTLDSPNARQQDGCKEIVHLIAKHFTAVYTSSDQWYRLRWQIHKKKSERKQRRFRSKTVITDCEWADAITLLSEKLSRSNLPPLQPVLFSNSKIPEVWTLPLALARLCFIRPESAEVRHALSCLCASKSRW